MPILAPWPEDDKLGLGERLSFQTVLTRVPTRHPVSCGGSNSCLKYPLRYIWKRNFYKPHLSCSVIIHCATSSNVLPLSGEMWSPREKLRASATPHWLAVSCPGRAEPADSPSEAKRGLPHGQGEEVPLNGRGSLVALAPAFWYSASWRPLAHHRHCLHGGLGLCHLLNDVQLFLYLLVCSSWQQVGIFN